MNAPSSWMGGAGIAVLALSLMLLLMLWLLFRCGRQTLSLRAHQQEEVQRQLQAEHDRLEREVAQRTAQLTELAQHLQTAREDERHRLARDLHDELGALLTAAKLDAARIRSRLVGTAPEALQRLAHLVEMLDSVIALKRRISEDLRPSALSYLGLVDTLQILAREFTERSGVVVHCKLAPVALAPAVELTAYRLVQEAINNLSKHAVATNVWLELAAVGERVEISVRDDGKGFDTSIPPASAYGLVGMRYRVEAEGGTMQLQSKPGEGTLIQVTLPQSTPEAMETSPGK